MSRLKVEREPPLFEIDSIAVARRKSGSRTHARSGPDLHTPEAKQARNTHRVARDTAGLSPRKETATDLISSSCRERARSFSPTGLGTRHARKSGDFNDAN